MALSSKDVVAFRTIHLIPQYFYLGLAGLGDQLLPPGSCLGVFVSRPVPPIVLLLTPMLLCSSCRAAGVNASVRRGVLDGGSMRPGVSALIAPRDLSAAERKAALKPVPLDRGV